MSVGSPSLPARKLAFFVGEQIILFLSFVGGALLVTRSFGPGPSRTMLLVQAALATLSLQAGLYLADLYDFKVAFRDAPRAARLLRALGAVTIVCGVATLLVPGPSPARAAAVAGLGGACTVALVLRAALPDLGRAVSLRARLLLIGQGAAAATLIKEIVEDGHSEVVAQVAVGAAELVEVARVSGADAVVVAVDDRRGLDVRELLACRLAGLDVFDAPTFAERALKKIPVGLARPSDLVFSDGFGRPAWLLLARRAVSLAAAVVLSVLALPILVIAAILIKLDSRGPLFYTQERVGAQGRNFQMLKFRTMQVGAETKGAVWAQRNDPRVTRVGKWLRRFRVDELPQIINVLKGEMNIVGPRPERPEFVAKLRTQIPYYDLRALVPPGITGWAQIRYPYAASLEEAREKLQYDLFYVKHLSVLLDLVILFHTAKVVLFGRGAR
ncbi:MAG TPA: exopolysaccharide biosynthesis polyprenyl glycosylphosphotransferase [Polyangia bacterium]|nr:exopolysaccharide biosynthesis polyprenyl glycosylphosphotransferase [Polyangia bacterium]